jgi:hypothetical protein
VLAHPLQSLAREDPFCGESPVQLKRKAAGTGQAAIQDEKPDPKVSLDAYIIHVYKGYMQKIQVLFPEPQMERLRRAAKRQDRPISDIIRRAVEDWLDISSSGYESGVRETPPRLHGGKVKVKSSDLRDEAYR